MCKVLVGVLSGALAGLLAVAVPQPSHAQKTGLFDHLKCYRIKADRGVSGRVDLTPLQHQLPRERNCRIRGPELFCAPVDKTNVRVKPGHPGAPPGPKEIDHLCYKVSCRGRSPDPLRVADQFGVFTVRFQRAFLMCTPARKIATQTTSTTSTSTSSTTSTTKPDECRLDSAGQCNGPCPDPNDRCLPVVGTTDCKCQPVLDVCHFDLETGTCGGTCPTVGDVCTLFGTTCDCVPATSECRPDATGACGGKCPDATQKCVPVAGGCDCVTPRIDCGAAGAPECDGLCPPEMACVGAIDPTGPGQCECKPHQLRCDDPNNPNGPPVCWGLCPPDLTCLATPLGCRCG